MSEKSSCRVRWGVRSIQDSLFGRCVWIVGPVSLWALKDDKGTELWSVCFSDQHKLFSGFDLGGFAESVAKREFISLVKALKNQ